MSTSPVQPAPRRSSAMLLALLVALAVVPFAPALTGSFVWDDNTLIANNRSLRAEDGWRTALFGQFFEAASQVSNERQVNQQIFRPVVSLLYWAEFRLWGLNVVGYHLVNLVLHAACAVLLFLWLRRRLASPRAELAAFLGAAMFATHPARAESVAWISGCTDVWMTLWVLLGLTCWDRLSGLAGGVTAAVAFSLAFFCKEVAVMVPVAIAAEVVLRGSLRAQASRLVALAAGMGLTLVTRLLHVGISGNGGVLGGPAETVVRVVATLGGYVRILLVPWPASTQAGYLLSANSGGPQQQFPPLSIALGIAVLLIGGALVGWGLRTPLVRPWLADAAWLFIPLLPVLNVVPLTLVTYVNERHIYLASLGFAALGARAALHLPARAAALAGAVLVAAYAAGSAQHALHFRSNEALWTYEAAHRPANVMALTNLLAIRLDQSRLVEAKELSAQIMAVMPRPEDKAAAFRHWLESDFREAEAGGEGSMVRHRQSLDRIAARETPEGECGRLYATIEEPGQRWLRRSASFRVGRARAAAATGDFASAVRQLDAFQQDAGPRSGALRPLVAALMAKGDWEGAQARIVAGSADPDAGRLQQVVLQAQAQVAAGATPEERRSLLATVLNSTGEPAMARAVRARQEP